MRRSPCRKVGRSFNYCPMCGRSHISFDDVNVQNQQGSHHPRSHWKAHKVPFGNPQRFVQASLTPPLQPTYGEKLTDVRVICFLKVEEKRGVIRPATAQSSGREQGPAAERPTPL